MKYIALTIGPIYKTLKNAKKTRELFGGSYIFSYIIKKIIEKFKDREFIVPYVKDDNIFETGKEVGLFHDRFIFASIEGDLKLLEEKILSTLRELADDSKIDFDFLKNYFQINFTEIDINKEDNIIKKISPILDSKELFFKVSQYEKNHLQHFLKNRLNSSFLIKDAFNTKRISFPSLPEISTKDLNLDKNFFNEDDDIFKEIKELKPYHK